MAIPSLLAHPPPVHMQTFPMTLLRNSNMELNKMQHILSHSRMIQLWTTEVITIVQVCVQDINDVLDPSYTPITVEEIELFEEMLKCMHANFEKTIHTYKGKALVRVHQKTYNAQIIYKEVQEYALLSIKATMEASSLLSYITTSNLDNGI